MEIKSCIKPDVIIAKMCGKSIMELGERFRNKDSSKGNKELHTLSLQFANKIKSDNRKVAN